MLTLREVTKTFKADAGNTVLALDHVCLEIEAGSFVVVIGTNGSGKSTLLNAIAGSVLPDGGSIHLGGRNITHWPEHRRARLISRVFQNPFSGTAPNLTVGENLALASRRGQPRGLGWALGRRSGAELRHQLASLGLGLEDRFQTPIGLLSGGQRQAITLMMATLVRPELLLLDEHTAALDPKSAEQIIRLTRQVVQHHHLTTLMVTHSMQQAVNVGDRLVMMYEGRTTIDCCGTAKQRLQVEELLHRFEELRRRELLDESAAEMLRSAYV
ncbi:MAG TPA: ATP-binding cassette domain-containing protein [Terriglobales bacterium]|nr:ATP-binding cassette domain-containing protein [Terriglobales bacterium]